MSIWSEDLTKPREALLFLCLHLFLLVFHNERQTVHHELETAYHFDRSVHFIRRSDCEVEELFTVVVAWECLQMSSSWMRVHVITLWIVEDEKERKNRLPCLLKSQALQQHQNTLLCGMTMVSHFPPYQSYKSMFTDVTQSGCFMECLLFFLRGFIGIFLIMKAYASVDRPRCFSKSISINFYALSAILCVLLNGASVYCSP